MADPDPAAIEVVRGWLAANEVEYEEQKPGLFSFALPGEKKLQTPVRVDVGPHALGVHAFVCRNPDENHEGVYRWLLERNLRLYAVAFGVDQHGDIYLDARLPLSSVTTEDLDKILASWFAQKTSDEAMTILTDHDVAAGLVLTIAEILDHPQFVARGNIVDVEDPDFGRVLMQGVVPKFSRDPGDVRFPGHAPGAHNAEVFGGLLGRDDRELDDLAAKGVI